MNAEILPENADLLSKTATEMNRGRIQSPPTTEYLQQRQPTFFLDL
jgi:hypothetical protein